MPSLRPAAEKLPVSTEATSKDIASRRSTEPWPWVSNIERTLFEDCRIIFKIDRADVQHRRRTADMEPGGSNPVVLDLGAAQALVYRNTRTASGLGRFKTFRQKRFKLR